MRPGMGGTGGSRLVSVAAPRGHPQNGGSAHGLASPHPRPRAAGTQHGAPAAPTPSGPPGCPHSLPGTLETLQVTASCPTLAHRESWTPACPASRQALTSQRLGWNWGPRQLCAH